MRGGPRVVWIKGSQVFHRQYRTRETRRQIRRPDGTLMPAEVTVCRCGAVISVSGLWRGQTGTMRQAEALGLRGCRRVACFPPTVLRSDLSGIGGVG